MKHKMRRNQRRIARQRKYCVEVRNVFGDPEEGESELGYELLGGGSDKPAPGK